MQIKWSFPLVVGMIVAPNAGLRAQSDLQHGLNDTHVAKHWIYNDLDDGNRQAKATGKPLLVVFRCVP